MSALTQNLGIGVKAFYYADVNSDVWTKVENIVEGSIAFTFSDPTETALNVEDKADPIATLRSKDTPDRIDLSFYNLSAAELAALMGGTATGEKYSSSITTPLITKRLRIVTQPFNTFYIIYTIESGQVLAKFAGAPSKKQAEQVNVSCVIQAAANALGVSISPYSREVRNEYVPFNLVTDDTANTLGFELMTGVITNYESSKDGGSTWVDVAANPVTGMTGVIALGAAQIRAKVAVSSPQKNAAVSEKAFAA